MSEYLLVCPFCTAQFVWPEKVKVRLWEYSNKINYQIVTLDGNHHPYRHNCYCVGPLTQWVPFGILVIGRKSRI